MNWLKRAWGFTDDRLGISRTLLPIVQHPTPRSTNWWYVFGSATLAAFIVQVVTGVALAFTYVPAPNSAYDSLQFITHDALFGNVVRGVHYWGASAMIVLIFIHTCRTFLMGAFKYPREFNWLTGVLLLFLTLGMGFTGQLLRWDQDAYWAVVVAAEQAGRTPFVGSWMAHLVVAGSTVGGATLTRFYATHVFLIPGVMFGMLGAHLYLLIRHGISDPPVPGRLVDPRTETQRYDAMIARDGVPFWPDAAWRDVVFALAVGSVVLALAIVVGPKELGALADPTNVNASPRPDWYFLWLFALLALIPPALENYFIIGLPLLAAVGLLIVPAITNKGERSARRRPWAPAIVAISTVAIAVLIWEGDRAPWSPNLTVRALPVSLTQGLPPTQQPGAQLFATKGCINCHTIAGTGGKRGPDLSHVGDRLSAGELTTRILNGGNNMPAYGSSLAPQDLTQLVEFLAGRQQGGP